MLGDQAQQLLAQAVARVDSIADVGPIETGEDQAFLGNAEVEQDIGAGMTVGRRGEREARRSRLTRLSVEQRTQ